MSEHLDPESTAPDLPDGYDPDGGWTAQEWWDALGDPERVRWSDFEAVQRLASVRSWDEADFEFLDEQRDAHFDDEETRP